LGYLQVRQHGSHIVMQKQSDAGTVTIPVPDHDELAIGTLSAIIRKSGVPRSEFEA
jgi:predicted RNA binding protein YcfA (HicA-like mRNA interferase family)